MLHPQHMFPSLATEETSQETMFQQQCFLVWPGPVRNSSLKEGVYLKMSEKSDFFFSLELASSTIGLHIGKSCFGVFSKF